MSIPGILIIIGLLSPVIVNSANILILLPVPSPSHHIWNTRIVKELATRGHNVTALSVDLPKTPIINATYIHLEKTYESLHTDLDIGEFKNVGVWQEMTLFYNFQQIICQGVLVSKGFQTLRNYPKDFKFDLVISDITTGPCLLGFLQQFNYPPFVAISAYKYYPQAVDVIGGHNFPAYIPLPGVPFSVNMTFCQRLKNTALLVFDHFYKDYIFLPKSNEQVAPYFDKNLPSLRELEQRAAVLLLNIHPSTDFPVPLPPNLIEVGGLQIADVQPLPKDFENFITNSKSGAVLIAFGTNVDSKLFDDNQQMILIEAVKRFPTYNFLWKFEKDPSNGKVPNLMVTQWLPQNDILAHPKIKAFVSHGGGLSTHEATWHGVPVIAVPFLMDQRSNTFGSILAGVAVEVDVSTMTVEVMANAIRTILEDRSYAERMKLRSRRFKDRPMKPLDTAIWWIEYVLRDPNPTHLRSPTIALGIWRSNSYDFIFYTVILIFVVLWVTCKVIKKACKLLSSDTKRSKVKFN